MRMEEKVGTTKRCYYCKNTISKEAEFCPHCTKKQSNKWIKIFAYVLVFVISFGIMLKILSITSSTSKASTNSHTSVNSSNSTSKTSSETTYNVTDTILTSKIELNITRVRKLYSVGSKYLVVKPSEGAIYVAVDYKYKNITKEPLVYGYKPEVSLLNPDKAKYSADFNATTYCREKS